MLLPPSHFIRENLLEPELRRRTMEVAMRYGLRESTTRQESRLCLLCICCFSYVVLP